MLPLEGLEGCFVVMLRAPEVERVRQLPSRREVLSDLLRVVRPMFAPVRRILGFLDVVPSPLESVQSTPSPSRRVRMI